MMDAVAGERSLVWTTGEDARPELDIAALVQQFSGLLYRVAFSVVRQPAEAEDVVQETFLRVLEARRKLREVREMRPWLVRIAWNCALDRKRRITPAQLDETFANTLLSRETAADQALAQARELAEVLAALDHLPARERQVLVLSAIEELSTAEIADVVGRSESSVRSIAFRARTRLHERLQKGARR
jgi:RNA polymerase sigma-70 factor (ECF subfamily)